MDGARHLPRRVGTVVVVALAGAGALGVALRPRPGAPAVSAPAAVPLPVPTTAPAADRDPSFPTAAQARTYYGAVVQGERNALRVVRASLAQVKASRGDAKQIESLERMEAAYTQRLKRHEARLAAAGP